MYSPKSNIKKEWDNITVQGTIFHNGRIIMNTPEKQPCVESQETGSEKGKVMDLMTLKSSAKFEKDAEKTLDKLSKGNETNKNQIREAIQENLYNQDYKEYQSKNRKETSSLNELFEDFWKELEKNGCNTVKIEEGRIKFLKDNVDVAPKQNRVAIKVDLSRFITDAPESTIYNSETGVISFKDSKEEKEKRIDDIIVNPVEGTRIKISKNTKDAAAGKFRIAMFTEGEDGFTAYYCDKEGKPIINERVKIYKDNVVKLESQPTKKEKQTGSDIYINGEPYTRIGSVKKSQNFTYEQIAKEILSNPNQSLISSGVAKMVKDSAITLDEYAELLSEAHIAAGNGDLMLIVMPHENRARKTATKKAADTKKETEQTEAIDRGQRQDAEKALTARYDRTLGMIRAQKRGESFEDEGVERKIDRTMEKLIANKDAWDKAWKEDEIQGLEEIRNIVKMYPKLFGKISQNPDLLRDKIYDAVKEGKKDNIYPQDIIKKLDIKLPNGKDYGELLAQSTIYPNGNAEQEKLLKEATDITIPIEQLTDAIGALSYGTKPRTEKVRTAETGKEHALKVKVDMARFGNEFTSISKLESLSGAEEVPGIPIDHLETKGNDYIPRMRQMATALGIPASQFKIPQDEGKNLIKNDAVRANIIYKGQRLSIKLDRSSGWARTYIAAGFDNKNFGDDYISSDWSNPTSENFTRKFDDKLKGLKSELSNMRATPDERGIIPNAGALDEFNANYLESKNYDKMYALSRDQLTELVFTLYTFEQLVKENCIAQVEGEPNRFVLIRLPAKMKQKPLPEEIKQAAIAVKLRESAGKEKVKKAQETLNPNLSYLRRLKKLFPGIARFDDKGNKINMAEMRAKADKGGQKSAEADDIFFKNYDGNAAMVIFLDQVLDKKADGNESIDVAKANSLLTEYYRKGAEKIRNMPEPVTERYKATQKELKNDFRQDLRNRPIDINKDLAEWDIHIIQVGFVEDEAAKEVKQDEKLNEMIEKMAKEVGNNPELLRKLQAMYSRITGPKLEKALKQLPIGILLSYQRTAEKNNIVGLHTPIMLPFPDENINLVLIPGISTDDRASIAIGISDRAKATDRITLVGGFSMGVSGGKGGLGTPLALSGGIETRIYTADKDGNYNHFLGIRAGAGVDLSKGTLGINFGPYHKWDVDAQKKYDNGLNEKMQEKGIKEFKDRLEKIYEKGVNKKEMDQLANDIKASPIATELKLEPNATTEQTIASFKNYVALFIGKFTKDFSLGLISGGEIGLSISEGLLIVSGAVTGNVPVVIGTTSKWAIGLLASLKINIDSRITMGTTQTTSDEKMSAHAESKILDYFNEEFNKDFDRSTAEKGLEISGKNKNKESGKIRTTESVNGKLTELDAGTNIEKYNEGLKEIGLKLTVTPSKLVEIEFLKSMTDGNIKVIIGPEVAVLQDGRLFMKDPNSLRNLYFSRQNKPYPFEDRHGAYKDSVILLSTNKFLTENGQFRLPQDIVLMKNKGESEYSIIKEGKKEKPQAVIESKIPKMTTAGIRNANDASDRALYGGEESKEEVRENIKELAAKLYRFKNSRGETFLSITNQDGKDVKDRPSYTKEDLFKFFDEFTQKEGINNLNGTEKEQLMVECSTLRYTELKGMGRGPEALKKRLEWARDFVLKPFFEKRIEDLGKQGIKIANSADRLAQKAIDDISGISINQNPSKLELGTSTAVAIGRYGKGKEGGLNQLLNGGTDNNPYGYIIGKDYTEALNTKQPAEDYELALLLKEQVAPLGRLDTSREMAPKDIEAFMENPFTRKVASLHHLIFILGEKKYKGLTDYYSKGETKNNQEAIKAFADLVKWIRAETDAGHESAIHEDKETGLKYLFTFRHKIQTGVFNKCGNFAITNNDEIGVKLIQPEEGGPSIYSAKGEAMTSVTTKLYKEFLALWGGVSASIAIPEKVKVKETPPEKKGEGEPPKEETPPPKTDEPKLGLPGSGDRIKAAEPKLGLPGSGDRIKAAEPTPGQGGEVVVGPGSEKPDSGSSTPAPAEPPKDGEQAADQ